MFTALVGRLAPDGPSPFFFFLMAVVTLGPQQFGYHLAELNAPQDVLTCAAKGGAGSLSTRLLHSVFSRSFLKPPDCIPMSEAEFATVSSAFTVGGLFGALAAGPLISHKGRLLGMRLTACLFLLGSCIETMAPSVVVLAAGRVLNGFSAGASTVIVPLYISEVAPVQSRGFFGVFTQITVNTGILFTQTLGFFLSFGSAWRAILGVGIVSALVHMLGLCFAPESPAWLLAHHGDAVRSRRILARLHGNAAARPDSDRPATGAAAWSTGDGGLLAPASAEEQGLLDPSALESALAAPGFATTTVSAVDGAIVAMAPPPSPKGSLAALASSASSHRGPSAAPVGFVQLVTDPYYRRPVIAVMGIMTAQQLCGINSVIMYSVSLLKGMLPISSGLLTIIISAVNLMTTMLCAPLPDRLGRKACIIVSVIGQGTSSLILAVSIVFGFKVLSALSVLTFVAFFAVGLGPVPFMLASELVGQEAVGATQSWALGVNYVATFLIAQFFPLVNSALNARFGGAGWVYFLFSIFAVLSVTFISVYVPETKGKKDADEVWGRTRHAD